MRKDKVMPEGKWEFDAEVAESFEDMLIRSIPQYDVMRDTVFNLVKYFIGDEFKIKFPTIMDIGSSRGDAIAPLIDEFGAKCNYVLAEISDPMLQQLHKRFDTHIHSNKIKILKCDLRNDFPSYKADLTLSILTLMFVPIECRQLLIKRIYNGLSEEGVFICVEKHLTSSYETDVVFTKLYYDKKKNSGYTEDAIERKRLSLQGVLVPITSTWMQDMLSDFKTVECFWRWMNFTGWIAIK